jgi:hypothetical protein
MALTADMGVKTLGIIKELHHIIDTRLRKGERFNSVKPKVHLNSI